MDSEIKSYLLWKHEATQRSQSISDVKYEIKVYLGIEEYSVILTSEFLVQDPLHEIWLDFKGEQIIYLKINNEPVQWTYRNFRIFLPGLKRGKNSIEIGVINKYSRDGYGFHYFKDPKDDAVYIYTHLEPFSANRFIPCFDQPDLKSDLTFIVKCPMFWSVISNDYALDSQEDFDFIPVSPFPGPGKTVKIALSSKISTYLFALCAGEFLEFLYDEDFPVTLKVFCRKSLYLNIKPGNYFDMMAKALVFYGEFFDYPYPFKKLDLVFVPEFVLGAMENVACITFNEGYIYKKPSSVILEQGTYNLVFHEISHMWFGDLVSVKWWDDIWLKESFATFMASLCIEHEVPRLNHVWEEFCRSKCWGYDTDLLKNTHAISTNVSNTAETRTNFDGISYSKGSAVLKQLYFITGKERFQKACAVFVKRYEFGNADYFDFINCVKESCLGLDIDINEWSKNWILTPGLNIVEPLIEFENGSIKSLKVIQSAEGEQNVLRDHFFIVSVFDRELREVFKKKVHILPEELTVLEDFQGVEGAAVLLNIDDWDFCNVRLDKASLSLFKRNLEKIENPLSRILVYRVLKMMVNDLFISGAELVDILYSQILYENDYSAAEFLLDQLYLNLKYNILEGAKLNEYFHKVYFRIKEKLNQQIDAQILKIYKNHLFNFLYCEGDVLEAVEWLNSGNTGISNFVLNHSSICTIIKEYSCYSLKALDALHANRNRFSESSFRYLKIFVKSKLPDLGMKEKAWKRILNEGERFSNYERRQIMLGFIDARQKGILQKYGKLYFDNLEEVVKNRDRELAIDYVKFFIPSYVDDEWLAEQLRSSLGVIPKEQFEVFRCVSEALEKTEKRIRFRLVSDRYLDRDLG